MNRNVRVHHSNLDAVDHTILTELQTDARMTNRALSLKTGLAQSSTSARVRELEDRGVISGYHATVDLNAIGLPVQAMVFVKLSPTDDKTIRHFLETVTAMPETLSAFLISGVEDAIVHVAVADVEHLRQTVVGKISALDAVVDERTSLVFDELRQHVIAPMDLT